MGKHVMIVDDEYTIRELVALSLEPDYDVIKAEDGKQALELVAMGKDKVDLIILDIMMPKMDGYEVCRKLKADQSTKDIPIIILTAKHMLQDLKDAIRADADEFLTKPFEPDHLKKRVDAHLQEPVDPGKLKRKLFQYGKSLHYVKGGQEE